MNPAAISAARLANEAASLRRAPPKSVPARTRPAHAIPMQTSVARETANKKTSGFPPPVAPRLLHELLLLYPNVVPQRQTTQGATRDRAQGRDLPRLFTHKKALALRFGTGAPGLRAEVRELFSFAADKIS